jgi:hypothetical protein
VGRVAVLQAVLVPLLAVTQQLLVFDFILLII